MLTPFAVTRPVSATLQKPAQEEMRNVLRILSKTPPWCAAKLLVSATSLRLVLVLAPLALKTSSKVTACAELRLVSATRLNIAVVLLLLALQTNSCHQNTNAALVPASVICLKSAPVMVLNVLLMASKELMSSVVPSAVLVMWLKHARATTLLALRMGLPQKTLYVVLVKVFVTRRRLALAHLLFVPPTDSRAPTLFADLQLAVVMSLKHAPVLVLNALSIAKLLA